MITFFTIPKSFKNNLRLIQINAIRSWQNLFPEGEILVFGDDEGVEKASGELGVRHIPNIEKNRFGTPLLSHAFSVAQEVSKYDTLVYANTDIIFMPNLSQAINKIHLKYFLVCGRRWDLDLNSKIDFSESEWSAKLLKKLNTDGNIHGPSGIDYFIFKQNSVYMPPFAVGRPGWDGWLIFDMRRRKIPVIDATESITVIHQNHDYSHSSFDQKKRVGGPELIENIKLAGGRSNIFNLRDADWILTNSGIRKAPLSLKNYSAFSLFYPWRLTLSMLRRIRLYWFYQIKPKLANLS